MSTLSLHSQINLNNGRQIPAIGLGVYRAAPGESAEQAVSTALKVSVRGPYYRTSSTLDTYLLANT